MQFLLYKSFFPSLSKQTSDLLPPSVWNKDSLSSVLCEFIASKVLIVFMIPQRRCLPFNARKNKHKVMNSFVIFIGSNQSPSFDHPLGNMRGEQYPSFFPWRKICGVQDFICKEKKFSQGIAVLLKHVGVTLVELTVNERIPRTRRQRIKMNTSS